MEELLAVLREHDVTLPENPTRHQLDNIEELVASEIESTAEGLCEQRLKDPTYALDILVPMISEQLQAMLQVQTLIYKLETSEETTSTDLMHDYGLWVGHCTLEPIPQIDLTPKAYIEEFLEAAHKPHGQQVHDFLMGFYKDSENQVDEWMASWGYQK